MKIQHALAAAAIAALAFGASAAQASTNLVYQPGTSASASSAIAVGDNSIMLADLLTASKTQWYFDGDTRYIFGNNDPNGTIIIDLGSVKAISSIGAYIDLPTQVPADRVVPGPVSFATAGADLVFSAYGSPVTVDNSTTNPVSASGLVMAQYVEYSFGPTGDYFSDGGGSAVNSVFATAVPEPATWAMMLLGFGVLGWTLRGNRQNESRKSAAVHGRA